MKFSVGDKVIVLVDDSDSFGVIGEVKKITDDDHEDGPIAVHFTENQYGWPKEETYRFRPWELSYEEDAPIPIRANSVYGRDGWHRVEYDKTPLDLEKDCMVEGCPQKRERRVLINIWGTVYSLDACDPHADHYHGLRGEVWPRAV